MGSLERPLQLVQLVCRKSRSVASMFRLVGGGDHSVAIFEVTGSHHFAGRVTFHRTGGCQVLFRMPLRDFPVTPVIRLLLAVRDFICRQQVAIFNQYTIRYEMLF